MRQLKFAICRPVAKIGAPLNSVKMFITLHLKTLARLIYFLIIVSSNFMSFISYNFKLMQCE